MIRLFCKFYYSCCLGLIVLLFININLFGQTEQNGLAIARQQVIDKQYESADAIYEQLYNAKPYDKSLYKEYLAVLLQLKKYELANHVIDKMQSIRRDDATILIDKGIVWQLQQQKPPKINPFFEEAYNKVTADEYTTRQIADAFEKAKEITWAIKVYEKAGNNIYNNTAYFAKEVAILYAQLGQFEKAIKSNIALAAENPRQLNDVKEALAKFLTSDAKNNSIINRELDKQLKEQPQNVGLVLIKVWLFTQQNNYQEALDAVISYDKSSENGGNQILGFVKMAQDDGQYEAAIKGTEAIMALGKSAFVYEKAVEENLRIRFIQLQELGTAKIDPKQLESDFHEFLLNYPEYYGFAIIRDYAQLKAVYLQQVDAAIAVLQAALQAPNISREIKAWCKMDIGDYLIRKNDIWEATLIYSQVEKEYKQDPLGEQARYKNALLAYFNQDFDWAQDQLRTIKAATSELLANDAMYLSILITENVAPLDTAKEALKQFALADLMYFQNQYEFADSILQSLFDKDATAPIIDDVYMMRAKIAMKQQQPQLALNFLNALVAAFPQEVLADDAIYTMATIYEKQKDTTAALAAYEKIITAYAGSTYIHQARIKYNELKKQVNSL